MRSLLAACIMILFTLYSHAQHEHHAKHNMIMLGTSEIFISHIVYKVPHNYQVILKVKLDSLTLERYFEARRKKPKDLMIILLDHMDISKINEADSIAGTIYSENPSGERIEVIRDVRISRSHFKVIYFDEVPLHLTK